MRNMEDYEQKFMKMDFERYQEKYRRRLVEKVIDTYAVKDCSILEIGCGLMPLFTDYQDIYSFTVVEPAVHCYENARALAEDYSKVVCYQGFFEDVVKQIKEKKFDIIICSGLLHELEKPEELLRAMKTVCHRDSIVHINVANALSLHRLLAREMGLIESVYQLSDSNLALQQSHVFDMEQLKDLVSDEGYQVIDSGSYFLKPFTHRQMQQCMDEKILNVSILEGLDRLCEGYFKDYGSEIYLNVSVK